MDEIEDIDLPNFNAIFKFTKGGERIDAEKLVSELGELTQYQYYICGGNSFVEAMKQIVRDAGVSMDNISLDNFGI
jgi:ferredoxin-NADP reductase